MSKEIDVQIDFSEQEYPKSNTQRRVKVTYSITGEVEMTDMGDEYVNFKDQDQQDRYDKQMFIKFIEGKMAAQGLEGFDYNISIKSRDLTDEDEELPF